MLQLLLDNLLYLSLLVHVHQLLLEDDLSQLGLLGIAFLGLGLLLGLLLQGELSKVDGGLGEGLPSGGPAAGVTATSANFSLSQLYPSGLASCQLPLEPHSLALA